MEKYTSFRPGKEWLDTDGKKIHAHGGSIIYVDGTYYWYGENKERSDGKNGVWTWGVRMYASEDLYNWRDLGLIIEPNLTEEASSLNPYTQMLDRPHIIYNRRTKKYVCWMKVMHFDGTQTETVMTADCITSLNPYTQMLDRPHIIYNRRTKKYVCWMKVMHFDGTQTETVMTADCIRGPYEMVREGLRPLNMSAGDFDLAVAEDGKAYYYFERVHSETICADLTEDYTDVTGYYSTHFPHTHPPYVREATAHMERNGKHYLFTSGTTGYMPNSTEAAIADTWHGPYTVLGNPHAEDDSNTSFHSQISCIFKVEGTKDLYIACADRWAPDKMDVPYETVREFYDKTFSGSITEEERNHALAVMGDDSCRNTSIAEYVWLPILFEGDRPYIMWMDEWRLEDFL